MNVCNAHFCCVTDVVEESDIVNAVLFLLSDNSSMINGTFLTVDGGFTV